MISDAFGSNRIPFRKDCSCHFSNCDWQFLQRDMIFVALVSLHSCFCYLHFPSTASLCSSPFHPRASPVYPDSSLHFVPELPGSDFPDSGTNSASAYWGSSCFAPLLHSVHGSSLPSVLSDFLFTVVLSFHFSSCLNLS